MDLSKYAKALVPIGVMAVLAFLSNLGITRTMSVEEVVTLLFTAGLVWLVPNKK